MSHLAPGRTHDINMLVARRDSTPKYTIKWNKICLKIEDLLEEGKCKTLCSLRGQLLGAARAGDHDAQIKLSHQIDKHMKYNHRQRFMRGWLKKG